MSKDVAEKVIIESLDNAISDFARARKVSRVVDVLPENFTEVIEVIKTEPVETLEPKKPRKVSTKLKSRKSKKHSKISAFLNKKVKALPVESIKKAKRSRLSFVKKIGNYYNLQRKNFATGVLGLLMLGFVTGTTYVTYAYVSSGDGDLISKVGTHMMLPEHETPKVYIVQSEKADIFQNPSFKGIAVGDNVLTYSNAGKVVIYRSSEDKIVNIVNLQN
jgi:hypothetical protein